MPDASDFVASTIKEFRANGGRVGGPFAGAPLLLLHSTGAKSGSERIAPVMYLPDGERYMVFASKGGAPSNPGWYHNLKLRPETVIEVGSETLPVRAVELEGAERDSVYARQAQLHPQFAEYQARTERTIPVLALTRLS